MDIFAEFVYVLAVIVVVVFVVLLDEDGIIFFCSEYGGIEWSGGEFPGTRFSLPFCRCFRSGVCVGGGAERAGVK